MHPKMTAFSTEIPTNDEKAMENFQRVVDSLADAWFKEEQKLASDLGISINASCVILYLRTRSRWTKEKEDHLIQLDKEGKELPNVLAGEF